MRYLLMLLILSRICFTSQAGEEKLTSLEQSIASATDKVYPSLVYIQPVSEDFSTGQKRQHISGGSGVIFTKDGHVITNYHVVSNAKLLLCTFSDKSKARAEIVGCDPDTDIAVIKITEVENKRTEFPFASLGSSASLRIGQHVLAMGSPFGYERSVSLGIVSCLDRYLPDNDLLPSGEQTGSFNAWIQTDAAINPGNSGGPLVNLSGEVVGINSRVMMFGNSIGFAIPIDVVKTSADSIMKNGRVIRSFLGISIQETEILASGFERPPAGVLICGVAKESPAEKAGLKPGSIVSSINGKKVDTPYNSDLPSVRNILAALPVGMEVTMEVRSVDENLKQAKKVTLVTVARPDSNGKSFECEEWGFTAKDLTDDARRAKSITATTGVFVQGVKSGWSAAEAGLLPEDILLEVNEKPVANLDKLKEAYSEGLKAGNAKVLLTVERKHARRFMVLVPGVEGPEEGDSGKLNQEGKENKEGKESRK